MHHQLKKNLVGSRKMLVDTFRVCFMDFMLKSKVRVGSGSTFLGSGRKYSMSGLPPQVLEFQVPNYITKQQGV